MNLFSLSQANRDVNICDIFLTRHGVVAIQQSNVCNLQKKSLLIKDIKSTSCQFIYGNKISKVKKKEERKLIIVFCVMLV